MESVFTERADVVRIKRAGGCKWVRPSDGSFQHCEGSEWHEGPQPCGGASVLDEAIREVAAEDDG